MVDGADLAGGEGLEGPVLRLLLGCGRGRWANGLGSGVGEVAAEECGEEEE